MSDNAKFTFVNLTVKAGGQISNTSSGETTIVEATTDVEIAVDVAVDVPERSTVLRTLAV